MPSNIFVTITSWMAPAAGYLLSPLLWSIICPYFRGLSLLDVNIVDAFLRVCSHYVSSYNDYHHHATCDCCVLWSIPHHHDSYSCFNLCEPDYTGSARCGFDSEGHNEGFC